MLSSIIDAFKVPELRKKILFTLAILALYRFGAYVPVPGIPFNEFANSFQDSGVSMTMLDLFTGGALSNFSVFSLGIMPYITASIIMQLMQGVIPAIGRWAKEGETGRRKITQITRYLTLGLGLINAVGYLLLFKSPQYGVVFSTAVPEVLTDVLVVFTLVAGTAFIMWMGELITQRGIGNGMSLIIFVSIVSRVPSAIFSSMNLTADTGMGIAITVLTLIVVLACIPAIIFVERAQRRIPVNYAKRVQGRKMMGGQSTYIPLKVNAAGVIPIIFASCLIYFPAQLAALFNVGGFANFAANLDPALVEPHIDGSILGDIITYLVFTMAGAEMWQRAFAAKSRRAAKRGMFLGTAVYGVTIVLVYFMGVVGRQILGGDILAQYGSTDAVVPALAIRILPAGLTGLALAGMLSVIMSTADSYLLVSVQTCVHDIGKTIRPQMPERTEISLSRIFSIVLPLGALVIALYIHNAYNILMFAWSFYAASAGIPAFAALFWKKATKTGVMAGLLGGFVVCVGWKLAGQPFGLGAAVPGTVACGIALVVVSLATYKRAPSVFLKAEKQS